MIYTTCMLGDKLVVNESLPTKEALQKKCVWLNAVGTTEAEKAAIKEELGVDMRVRHGTIVEDGDYLFMFANLVALNEKGEPSFYPVTFILGDNVVITFGDKANFPGFNLASQRIHRQLNRVDSPRAILRILLQAANDTADTVIHSIVESLEKTADYISEISDGYDEQGNELGVNDMTSALLDLNEVEELISRCLEAQIDLGRVARYLKGEINRSKEAELLQMVDDLAGDIASVKEHAAFEHEKVRYLQSVVTNVLNIKQSQIVKVFTIVTAVFLPPTLVATFYGMNFSVMPELSWKHGFTFSMLLTLVAAILPMAYIKKKGWLR